MNDPSIYDSISLITAMLEASTELKFKMFGR